jgi:TetR/AcrR family transcriptional regulator, repressor of fatR-cypB operon
LTTNERKKSVVNVAEASAAKERQPQMRRIDPEEKKARVMQAARRLFVQQGYHNVSVPTIVKESGVSTGAIYSYFPNKEALAHHIHEQTLDEFNSLFLQRLAGQETAYLRLRAFAELVFDLAETDPDVMEYLLFMRHGEFMQGAAPICFSEPFRMIRQIIAEGMQAGEIREGDAFISGISFTGAILRAVELRFRCVLDCPLHEIAEPLIANAWAAIKV